MTERGEGGGGNNREAKGGVGKEARPQQSSGRFQLVMETGVAHPAAAVTDLTCPPDIHLQSPVSFALQATSSVPLSILTPSFLSSIHLNLHDFILTSL